MLTQLPKDVLVLHFCGLQPLRRRPPTKPLCPLFFVGGSSLGTWSWHPTWLPVRGATSHARLQACIKRRSRTSRKAADSWCDGRERRTRRSFCWRAGWLESDEQTNHSFHLSSAALRKKGLVENSLWTNTITSKEYLTLSSKQCVRLVAGYFFGSKLICLMSG